MLDFNLPAWSRPATFQRRVQSHHRTGKMSCMPNGSFMRGLAQWLLSPKKTPWPLNSNVYKFNWYSWWFQRLLIKLDTTELTTCCWPEKIHRNIFETTFHMNNKKIGPEISGLKTEKFPHPPIGLEHVGVEPSSSTWLKVRPSSCKSTHGNLRRFFFPRILRPSIWFHLGEWFTKTIRPLKRAWAAMALGGGVTLSLRFSAELFPWQFCVLPKKQRTKKSRTHRHSDDNGWSTKSRDIGVSYILKMIFIYFQVSASPTQTGFSHQGPVSSVVKDASTSGCWNTRAIIPAAVTSCTTTTAARHLHRATDIVVWGKIFGWYPKKARRQPKGV